ncbi:deoxyribodipyrimidine photo-lyase [Litorivivens lipolytica]|uniref:Deoxyribodipyrimidine photo-lyase n=1 Tax=Litorivivens lipolytica TaxID=1524264 RepID=A0A7W4Z713_9GAMM|nr:deoxyribodipyrimidine photo-lyase [Litorivivens lipolytica]MBB3047540.1 deoxyribodipyrimidine photo-lyase [Litorivivens lipolytica]
MSTLIWFRTDLRTHDNTALHFAAQHAHDNNEPLRAVFIATPGQWQQHVMSARQQFLIFLALDALQKTLAEKGIAFDLLEVETFADIPKALSAYANKHKASALFANREYLVNEIRRDEAVETALTCPCHWHHDKLIIEPGALLNGSGQPYKVFSPFAKAWRALRDERRPTPRQRPRALGEALKPKKLKPFCEPADIKDWPADEDSALQQLRTFCQEKVQDYKDKRDLPAEPGTSKLSAALAIGLLSPRQCLARLLAEQAKIEEQGSGEFTWLSELIWREFYQHVAFHYPRVVMGRAFKPETDNIRWRDSEEDFQAWCEGRTGFPIVDAGMRQLKETGWMHNRLRMITAIFLVKDLHIDWRRGEEYFMSQLIDGEFAANNGGWQWAASTGTDAAPYFRVFNPTTQGQRFDPEGHFIRRFVPELKDLSARDIHNRPGTANYPAPIVDHKLAREHAIALFKDL